MKTITVIRERVVHEVEALDMESENIKLIVKSPNQSVKDFPIECRPDWPVRVLKQRLSMVYPSKPVRVFYLLYM